MQKEEDYEVNFEDKDNTNMVAINAISFKDFLLRDELKKRLPLVGFEHPSEVQQLCLPPALQGLDILCQAKAGTGKTAVFILSILNRMLENGIKGDTCVLVLAHTRELAYQISKEFIRFSEGCEYKICLLIGGEKKEKQVVELKNKPHIIIGTSGRVLDLVKRGKFNLNNIQALVIDECDKMLGSPGKLLYY